jgi:protein-S-isoprenylcysteine O-methyltransferase Ste14
VFQDPYHWFPDRHFSTILAILVLGTFVIDYAVPSWFARRGGGRLDPGEADRSSFLVIRIAGIAAVATAVLARRANLAITPPGIQYAGLALITAALALREWAIIKLGRFFSRTVRIEPGHRLITDGPYRWIRHPAYTGMVLIFVGIPLALGTWAGAAAALAIMLAATTYRIKIEEEVLVTSFGDEYSDYMRSTWRLFPGW